LSSDERQARELDGRDPLRAYRERFHLPPGPGGEPLVYFAGNSLGLEPKAVSGLVEEELREWARLGVEGHMRGKNPWYSYHERFRGPAARLVGALPDEVVIMNGLSVNLHLLMVTFYRPTPERHKILIEERAFPSDAYAAQTQLLHHGYDPEQGLLVASPRPGEHVLRTEDVVALIEKRAEEIALVLLPGVHYFTGEVLEMPRIAAAARARGIPVGFDLAHAVGNVPLRMHDWGVDFAAWCSYKYLNAGPGAPAGIFVHERHARDTRLPRFGGWWGNDPATRFQMHRETRFVAREGADGWQLSNPPILAMAPLAAALALFDEAGMEALRAKSERLTGYLMDLVGRIPGDRFEVITPREPQARGCQASILVHERPRELFEALGAGGIVGDFREPNVIRVAPTPLYNTFHEVWRFARVLARAASDGSRPE